MLVQYDFEYTAKDGRLVSIKSNESFILVSKTNEHWWHVRKDQHTKPFYVPAQYVKELPSLTEDPTGPIMLDSPESVADSKPVDVANISISPVSAQGGARETYRFSTFGFCEDSPDVTPCETTGSFAHITDNGHNSTGGSSFNSELLTTDGFQLYTKAHPVRKARNREEESKSSLQDEKVEQPPPLLHNEDMDFPSPPDSPIYDTIPQPNFPEFDTFSELPDPVDSNEALVFEQQNSNQTAEATSPADVPPVEQVRFQCNNNFFIVFIHHQSRCMILQPGEGAVL